MRLKAHSSARILTPSTSDLSPIKANGALQILHEVVQKHFEVDSLIVIENTFTISLKNSYYIGILHLYLQMLFEALFIVWFWLWVEEFTKYERQAFKRLWRLKSKFFSEISTKQWNYWLLICEKVFDFYLHYLVDYWIIK